MLPAPACEQYDSVTHPGAASCSTVLGTKKSVSELYTVLECSCSLAANSCMGWSLVMRRNANSERSRACRFLGKNTHFHNMVVAPGGVGVGCAEALSVLQMPDAAACLAKRCSTTPISVLLKLQLSQLHHHVVKDSNNL